jgi:8-oxo-dGTP pyrophosphatase MutT (NUDIX family)
MILIYAKDPLPTKMVKSIFLAGPTPRGPEVESWRPQAIGYLEALGYDGHVFIPEPANGQWAKNYDDQVEWEEEALNQADCIMFWLPRTLDTMLALTTNDEWGVWKYSGKVVFGAPPTAEKVRYQDYYAKKYRVPTAESLFDTVKAAVARVSPGRLRQDGEVKVPLFVWEQPSFQSWYEYLCHAGNVLKDAQVLWTFRVGQNLEKMFCWVLQVSVYITSEDRMKVNEFVLGRPDVATIVLWHREPTLAETEVVLIREFRSSGRTLDGFLRECPGGSPKLGMDLFDPKHSALEELKQETGFDLARERLKDHAFRQVFGTLSAVGSFSYSAEITTEELAYFKSQAGQVHGVEADGERTFIEVFKVSSLLQHQLTDWATLGMIFTALSEAMR